MEKFLFQDLPLEEREKMVFDNADEVEEISYTRSYNEEERAKMQTEFHSAASRVEDLDEELDSAKSRIKGQKKPIVANMLRLRRAIRYGAESITGKCAKLIDRESGTAGYYTPEGKLVYERPLFDTEKQRTVFEFKRKASNE